MTFKAVFRSLQEVFPQVDLRILKAVAIEHSKDADAAVEFVLSEVLPSLSELSQPCYTLDDIDCSPTEVGMQQGSSSGHQGVEDAYILPGVEDACILPGPSVACINDPCNNRTDVAQVRLQFMEESGKDSSVEVGQEPEEVCARPTLMDYITGSFHFRSNLSNEAVGDSSFADANFHNGLVSTVKPKEQVISVEGSAQLSAKHPVFVFGSSHVNGQESFPTEHGKLSAQHAVFVFGSSHGNGLDSSLTEHGTLHGNGQDLSSTEHNAAITAVYSSDLNISSLPEESPNSKGFEATAEKDLNHYASKSEDQLPIVSGSISDTQDFSASEANDSVIVAASSTEVISSSTLESSPDLIESRALSEKVNGSFTPEYKDQHSRSLTENGTKLSLEGDISVIFDGNNKPTTISAQPDHVIRIDLLEDFMTDAESNKETLVSALDSVRNMMEEVELHEEQAKQAKEEASKAGLYILTKAEDLRQMLKAEKEANDMRAREVYGEKAILATEARELQTRLLNMSDERHKSLSIIEEIRSTLEAQLAAAEEERIAAEQEKLQKQEHAYNILMEQEFIMSNIEQESNRLKQAAEENAKWREFLMDRGHTVDALQGEISSICEAIKMLKERVDGHGPLHRSMPLRACSLASSSSSSFNGSMLSERILHPVELEGSPTMISGELPRSQEVAVTVDNKASPDDDWDFFDDKLEMFG